MEKSLLFTPCQIGGITIKNRMIATAMHTGFPIEQETAFLTKRAKGGAGVVTATMGVSKGGAHDNMCVLSDDLIPDLRNMADSVHTAGGKLFIQLFHAGRNGNSGRLADPTAKPKAPSPIPSPIYKEIPMELTRDEIKEIACDFARASIVCKSAGVDAVEISCSAGYLLSEFLSELTNQRQDCYGGSLENRMRFPLEVIHQVRESVGLDYPVVLRLSGSDMLGGYGIDLTVALAKEAEKDIDAINITGGWHESRIPQISMQVPEGGFSVFAREVKRAVRIPVIACNRINNRETAEVILQEGFADFVGCTRAFLADSEFGNKLQSGKSYRKCIGCNHCIERVLKGDEVACIFNPSVGREDHKTVASYADKKILVIGGGPAGMEAALHYAKCGGQVRLCTDEDALGGLMKWAAKAPHKAALQHNIQAMESELRDAGVELLLQTPMDGDKITLMQPDLVIVATGSRPLIPSLPGIHQKHVFTAQEVLAGKAELMHRIAAGRVLIIGGGAVGLETALFLAQQSSIESRSNQFLNMYADAKTSTGLAYHSNITIVEMSKRMGSDLKSTRWITMQELEKARIRLITETKVEQILADEVIVSSGTHTESISADVVVLAVGYQPQGADLIHWLSSHPYPFRVIGDANRVGTISNAISDIYLLT